MLKVERWTLTRASCAPLSNYSSPWVGPQLAQVSNISAAQPRTLSCTLSTLSYRTIATPSVLRPQATSFLPFERPTRARLSEKKNRNRNDKGEGLSYRGFYENVRFIFHYEDVEDEELWVGHPSRQTMDGASLNTAALYSGMNSMKWVRIMLENVNVEIRRSVVLYIKSDIQNKVYP